MIEAGRALAFMRGRDYVLPADVVDVAADVLRHRVVPSYEALAEGMTADDLVRDIMRAVPAARESAGEPCACRQSPEAILRRLDLPVMRRLEGLLQGDHRSPFARRGPGSGGSARIPVSRRCPAHGLERHRAPADRPMCANIWKTGKSPPGSCST